MSAINVFKDPYGRKLYAHKRRIEFEKFKKTDEFKSWRRIQMLAQKKRCAYCRVRLERYGIIIHVDHVNPLYYGGKNNIENLVISCSRCNMKKWINDRYVYPEWITENKVKHRRRNIIENQKRLMRDLVNRELDEQALSGELSWLLQERP